jgi:hypothetical protein
MNGPFSIFVIDNGDVYIDHGNNFHVDKLSLNPEEHVPVMNVSGSCYGLFVDIEDNLYCSTFLLNRVFKKTLAE